MKYFVKCIKANYMLPAIIYALLGLLMIIWPETITRIVCYGFGGLLIVYGLVLIISNFSDKEKTKLSGLNTTNGLISAGIGLFFMFKYNILNESIGFVMGLVLIIDAFIKFQKCIDLQKAKFSLWWVVLLLSFMTIGLAVLVFMNPFEITGLATLVGVCLLLTGISDIWIITRHVKFVTSPDIKNTEEVIVIDTENKD